MSRMSSGFVVGDALSISTGDCIFPVAQVGKRPPHVPGPSLLPYPHVLGFSSSSSSSTPSSSPSLPRLVDASARSPRDQLEAPGSTLRASSIRSPSNSAATECLRSACASDLSSASTSLLVAVAFFSDTIPAKFAFLQDFEFAPSASRARSLSLVAASPASSPLPDSSPPSPASTAAIAAEWAAFSLCTDFCAALRASAWQKSVNAKRVNRKHR
mmetsp:Transcript_55805/g.114078  ORF Transcript_55805/g.114078 Transcript_55805/m.114078 type:complete len:214 (-) Transcript_55805:358-999(-)